MPDQIERETLVSASLEEVWDVMTSPGWLAEDVQLELVPGGEACFRSGETWKTGWIEEADPPGEQDTGGRLVFWWREDDQPATRVELELTPLDRSETVVRVVESRPLEVLDLVGIPLPGSGGRASGPALVAA